MFRIDGRTALITGGTRGIGAAIADQFTEAGANVVVAGRRPAEGHHRSVSFDVSDDNAVAAGVAEARELLRGRIDILVNSAGVLSEAAVVDMSPDMWNQTLAVDLNGVFYACRHVVAGMIEQRWGRIINVASQLGIKGAPSMSHYVAAKAGVIGFTKSLALEVAKHNVLVNAIAPGPIETDMVAGVTDEWKQAKMLELPLGRFGLVEEVAPTALLLASDPGGNLFVGQTLGPNSGDVMP
ncbi:SDR family NAD(P)-dependent oxidoreductase [Pseudohalioglobus lutimaris]|uniref:3-oxoacyl-ACP reductase n=1 Tax=Pseudohalioglobus lutimaris TaxID=1737061 RepID=A0A2N5X538_9GAMM|nr:SDR family NAD(P)-dependent oxidoreductase [Pseudohalioglobus lutimaris]PLW69598.1 3-oxoacyl-ACP reductase [Pseudohalioglobus lutimaris]